VERLGIPCGHPAADPWRPVFRSRRWCGAGWNGCAPTGVLFFNVAYDHAPLGHRAEAMCRLTVSPRALAETGRAIDAPPRVAVRGGHRGQGRTRPSRCRAVPPRTCTRTWARKSARWAACIRSAPPRSTPG